MWLLLMMACPGERKDTGDDTATLVPAEICDNVVDDDEDTYADCFDPDCYAAAVCIRTEDVCDNGADDDGDKRIDCADDDCTADPACVGIENCSNEADDDSDTLVDCDDPDCLNDPACRTTK